MRVKIRILGAAVALVLVLGAAAGPGSQQQGAVQAQAATGFPDPSTLAEMVAAPWLSRQASGGSFPDYMAVRASPARDRYGDAMMGYGLLATGLQRGDEPTVAAGLRAIAHSVARPRPFHSVVFENLALAAAYNLARDSVSRHPLFVLHRGAWEARLRRMRPVWLGRGRGRYFNQHLVDAVAVLELVRSGLRSGIPGTVSSDPGRAARLAGALVNSGSTTALDARTARGARAGTTTLASDTALAYHALTLGFHARAVTLLGRRASPRARSLLGRLARASWALAAPDGDVAYLGRSQEQAWALPLTAYGAAAAADRAGPRWGARHRAVSERTLGRLRAVHVGGPNGLFLTPAFRVDPGAAIAAQEDYVSGSAYTGLTLVALGWAAERVRAGGPRPGRLAADRGWGAVLDRGPRRLATVSNGSVWFAVRARPADPRELGSGAGLVALKVRDRRGRWHDALAHGVIGRAGDSAGPLLRVSGGRAAIPAGRSLTLRGGRSVRLVADLLTPAGRSARRAGVVFLPGRCEVRITPEARRGERWEHSVFLATRPRPRRLGKRTVGSGELRVGYRGRGHIVTRGGYVSPAFGRLVRSRMSVRGPVTFSVGRCRG